jgi:lysophospholipase L1-like esterase
MSAALKRLLLAGASLALALILSEAALRIAGFSYHLRPEQVQLGWPKTLASLGDEYRSDPDLLWVHTDYGRRLDQARADRAMIAFLGDSCTDYSQYPAMLLAELAERRPGHPWTGVNLGTAGWTTFQGLRQLERDVLPLHPRVATIYYGWNDHWIGFGLPDEDVARLLRRTGSGWQEARLVQLGEKAWVAAHRSDDNRRVPLPQFESNLRRMVRLARGRGIEPVLITAPSAHEKGNEPQYLKGAWIHHLDDLVPLHQEYVGAVRSVAGEEKATLCDLAAGFAALGSGRRSGLFLKDGIHLNHHGSQRAATMLADCLERAGVLDRASASAPPP